jgi:hypothetical protein
MKLQVVRADSPLEKRHRLADAVDRLTLALALGEVTTSRVELEILAQLCEEQWLPCEAARVRRWLPLPVTS